MARPLVGICAAVERARWGPWDEVATLLPRAYAHRVQDAGGLALILPPDPRAEEDPDEILDRLDALVLAGGSDVDAASYGADQHSSTVRTWPERDQFEIALARRALERELPVLGVCRGMQVLNVTLGGTLAQHLPELLDNDRHRPNPGVFGEHVVRLDPRSLACRATGGERIAVKTHHHQGVDRLGEGLEATGWAEPDELVEAVELPDHRFALGVLWHPEESDEDHVIPSFVEAAAAG